jgi:predicted RNA-binding protein
MCDFTVYLEDKGEKKVVAKDILKARKKDGTVILMDAMGNITKIEAANIEVVDTLMQEMILKK